MNPTEEQIKIELARIRGEMTSIRALNPFVTDADFVRGIELLKRMPDISLVEALIRIGVIKE